jgi:[ribosomal protein S5]-alanine N-acetyltransferase
MNLTLARPLDTPRLQLRLPQADDVSDLLRINGDEVVTRYLPYATWQSLADAQAWLTRMAGLSADGSTLQLVVEARATGQVIGTCLLFRLDEGSARAELGYVLGRQHWGRGLMREALGALLDHAFGTLALRRIEAEVNPDNLASNRLAAALGFTLEGRLRQRWTNHGEHVDIHFYGLLRDEWPVASAVTRAGSSS